MTTNTARAMSRPAPSSGPSTEEEVRISAPASGMWEAISAFCQAEDGIRDLTVTGVQTCALPISLVNEWNNIKREARAIGRVLLSGMGLIPLGYCLWQWLHHLHWVAGQPRWLRLAFLALDRKSVV